MGTTQILAAAESKPLADRDALERNVTAYDMTALFDGAELERI